ncbi:hypothetical protein BLS_001888 [Venturia inaequalis]|nr:hypothetical protein BLS_001888 [Venturia inaequalis]RDI77858.1 hypothetical protein Vi05172_g12093 [Venturia inaequalis]
MAGLLELSTELLLMIASFLSQEDLLNISLTSKDLRTRTELELLREYTNIQLYGRSCKPLLRRLIEKPEVRRHVHRLDLKNWSTLVEINPLFGTHEEPALSTEDYDCFTEAARVAGLISSVLPFDPHSDLVKRSNDLCPEEWNNEKIPGWYDYLYEPDCHFENVHFVSKFCELLQAGIEDPLFMLMLTLLPNVQDLTLRGGPHGGQHLHLLPLIVPDHRFSSLRTLSVAATDGELEWPFYALNHLIHGRNLQNLYCYMSSEWDREDGDWDEGWVQRPPPVPLLPKSLNLTRLMLQYSAFSATGIKTLLHACRSLTWFHYSVGGKRVGPENFNCSELFEALLPLQTSLETLELDMETEWDYDDYYDYLPSLAEFSSLRTLKLGMELERPHSDEELLDLSWPRGPGSVRTKSCNRLCNLLPSSLRELKFQGSEIDYDCLSQIEEMAALKADRFPVLEKITMVLLDVEYEEWASSYREEKPKSFRLCKNAGVDLRIIDFTSSIERTFFEAWFPGGAWQEVRFKDGMYVKSIERSRGRRMMLADPLSEQELGGITVNDDSQWESETDSDSEPDSPSPMGNVSVIVDS